MSTIHWNYLVDKLRANVLRKMGSSYKPVTLAFKEYQPSFGTNENLAPVIYLHGLTASKEHWGGIPQFVADSTKRKAYAIDARNHGDSEWTDHWNFDVNADDLIHFLETHGISKAILVGHSMGGRTTIKTALKRPDLVEQAIIEDMGVRKPSGENLEMITAYVSLSRKAIEHAPIELDEDGVKKFIMKYVYQSFSPDVTKRPSTEDDYTHFRLRRYANGRFKHKANMEVLEKGLKNVENLAKDLEGVYEGPALFLYGVLSDFSFGGDEDHVKKFFPNAVFESMEGTGHSIHIEKPLEFANVLLKFVS